MISKANGSILGSNSKRKAKVPKMPGSSLSLLVDEADAKDNEDVLSSCLEQSVLLSDRLRNANTVSKGPYLEVGLPKLTDRCLKCSESTLTHAESYWTVRVPKSYLECSDFKRKQKIKREKDDNLIKVSMNSLLKGQDLDYFRNKKLKDGIIGTREKKAKINKDLEENLNAMKNPLMRKYVSFPSLKKHSNFKSMINEASALVKDKPSSQVSIIQSFPDITKNIKEEFDKKRVLFACKNLSSVYESQPPTNPIIETVKAIGSKQSRPVVQEVIESNLSDEIEKVRHIRLANFQRNVDDNDTANKNRYVSRTSDKGQIFDKSR